MHFRCPRCRNPIDIVDDEDSIQEVACPSCGSGFRISGGDADPQGRKDLGDPVSASVDGLRRSLQVLMGLVAAGTSLFVAFVGVLVFWIALVERQSTFPLLSAAPGLGLVVGALFMALMWVRLWFGPCRWLDPAIDQLFLKRYSGLFWVLVPALIILAFAPLAIR